MIQDITVQEIEEKIRIQNRHEAIHACVDLFVSRLEREENRLEAPPSFWFVVIPEIVYELGRPQSRVPRLDAVAGTVTISKKKAEELKAWPSLFPDEHEGADVYEYATHFRRQLKARLLKGKIVTQIVRETTIAPEDFTKANGMPLRRLEDPATVAWKLGTGAYYKGGGRPWQLAHVRPGVCYVGLVYKRTDLTADVRHACCAAQMFLSNGEGVVFRGAPGSWFNPETKQFHLDEAAAKGLSNSSLGSTCVCMIHRRRNCSSMRLPTLRTTNGPASRRAQARIPRCWGFRFLTLTKTSSFTEWETTRSFVVRRCHSVTGARFSGHRVLCPAWIRTWGRKRLIPLW